VLRPATGRPVVPVTPGGPARAISITAVLLVLGVGLLLVATDHWRRGATVLGAAAFLAGVLRLVVPERFIGVLAVRSKAFDVIFAFVLAAGFGFLISWP
jgi:hypothetical protein